MEITVMIQHALEDLHWYLKYHINDAQGPILRSKITMLYRSCNEPMVKKQLRGVLCYLNRWKTIKTYLKIAGIMEKIVGNREEITLEPAQIIPNCRFIKPAQIVRTIGNSMHRDGQLMICKSEKISN